MQMQMERERENMCNWKFESNYDYVSNYNHNHNHNNNNNNNAIYSEFCCNDDYKSNGRKTTSLTSSSSCSPTSGGGGGAAGVGHISHPVSKLDTLAGVAIKYGVEVADIKKMNGLVTDLQMFALKTLHIPLPGRHPPSACLSNGSDSPGQTAIEHTPTSHVHSDFFDSFQGLKIGSLQPKVSPAMSSLQGYYGLKSRDQKAAQGLSFLEDGRFLKASASNPPLSRHRKSKSFVSDLLRENNSLTYNTDSESEKWSEILVRRRQKSEADFTSPSSEMLIRDENNSGSAFFALTSKGLALRNKATRPSDGELGGLTSIQLADTSSGVRKSSSTSNLHDTENSSCSSYILGASMWSIKPDIPIFDGLPKPISGRKNKAALD